MDSGGSCGLQIRYRVGDPAEVGSTPTRSRQNYPCLKESGCRTLFYLVFDKGMRLCRYGKIRSGEIYGNCY